MTPTADPTTLTDLVDDVNGPVADYWRSESQGMVELTRYGRHSGRDSYGRT